MSNSERVATMLAPLFGSGEAEIDEAFAGEMAEVARDLVTDDFVVVMTGSGGFEGRFAGADGVRDAWTDWLQAFDRVRLEIEGVEDVGENVVVMARQVSVTKHDRVEMEQPSAAVWKFRGERIARLEFHLDRKEALRSAQSGQE